MPRPKSCSRSSSSDSPRVVIARPLSSPSRSSRSSRRRGWCHGPVLTGTVSKDGRIAYAIVAYPVPVANVTFLVYVQSAPCLGWAGQGRRYRRQLRGPGRTSPDQDRHRAGRHPHRVPRPSHRLRFGDRRIAPVDLGLAGVGVTKSGAPGTTSVINESSTTAVLATMIGLAVGIDYSLFVLNRHRQQLAEGMEVDQSVGRAVATSGSAVCFAGTTVLIALAAWSIVNIPFLTVMGLRSGRGGRCGPGRHHAGSRDAGVCGRATHQWPLGPRKTQRRRNLATSHGQGGM